ncbi:hypothetical protein A5717_26100 [Mycolicibacterium porcinum]|uniref:hypothetical protein n=1 Tax=Mycolicibacterium porcinum TaxID=39693 RepID=UPI00080B2B82|nr:hypothetical protein [Mycolicibacterium porcinum]OCB09250.1 hypothetical protein A5717_26100 [Mycolicibacterium porcinum]
MTDTTLRCIAGPWCRSAETINGVRHGVITGEQDTLCEPCNTYIAGCCHQLPADYEQLSAALGERRTSTTEFVRTSSTPAIPISTAKEALMVDIVDVLDRASAVVSEAIEADQPDALRNLPKARRRGEFIDAEAGSIADNTTASVQPAAMQRIRAWVAIVEPNVDELVAAPAQEHMLWTKPKRCDTHTVAVLAAENAVQAAQTARDKLRASADLDAARRAASLCDDCGGWDQNGQAAHHALMTGLDIAKSIVDVHNRVRAELGKTKLRHKYEMPCPRCWHSVGRDDGSSIITCDNPECSASWTEREYKLLAGMMADGQENQLIKWWLAEAYSRLDAVQRLIDLLTGDETMDAAGAGTIILKELGARIDGHARPKAREIATDKAATAKRQEVQDQWSWSGEKTYRPPRRRRRPPAPYSGPRIKTSSLTTVTDTEEPPSTVDRSKVCRCNEIHAGDCINEPDRSAS